MSPFTVAIVNVPGHRADDDFPQTLPGFFLFDMGLNNLCYAFEQVAGKNQFRQEIFSGSKTFPNDFHALSAILQDHQRIFSVI